jgi:hypothetical protein
MFIPVVERRWPYFVYYVADAREFSEAYAHVKNNEEQLTQLIAEWKKTKSERETVSSSVCDFIPHILICNI